MIILIIIGMTIGQIAYENSDRAKQDRAQKIELEVQKRLSEQKSNNSEVSLK